MKIRLNIQYKILFVIMQMLLVFSYSNAMAKTNDTAVLPFNNKVIKGELKNGLKYYILKNNLPSNKIEFRLNIRSGSLNETEQERGLAHFLEHMAFKGTKNYPDNTIVKFLEAAGLSFGPDTNAYTSHENTNYQLSVPYDNKTLILDTFQIFRDWAGDIVFKESDFNKERGVILEEERVRNTYMYRLFKGRFTELFNKSLYTERMPIGLTNIIKNAKISDLEGYYKKWYRPNNMSIVVVGNIDPAYAKKIIIEKFSDLKNEYTPKKANGNIEVPKGLRVKEINEKELKFIQLEMNYLYPGSISSTMKSFKEDLMLEAITAMFNKRVDLDIKEKKLDLQDIEMYSSNVGNNYKTLNVSVSLNKGDYNKYLDTFLREIEKVKRYGFTENELNYYKTYKMNEVNNMAQEGYKLKSSTYAEIISDYDTSGGYFLDFKTNKKLTEEVFKELKLEEYNKLIQKILSENDRVFVSYIPNSMKGKLVVTKDSLEAKINKISKEEIKKIEDISSNKKLITERIVPGKIINKIAHKNINATEFVYSNGVRLFVKKDTNKFKEFNFIASKQGGMSIMNNKEYLLIDILKESLLNSGFKGISNRELNDILVDKEISFGISSNMYHNSFYGGGKTNDIETLFQFLFKSITSTDISNDALDVIKDSYKLNLELAEKDDKVQFLRKANKTKYNDNYRRQYLLSSDIQNISKQELENLYAKYWTNDINNFVFAVVGDIDVNKVGELGAKYIGSIKPSNNKPYIKDTKVKLRKHNASIVGNVQNEYKSTLDFTLMKNGNTYEYGEYLSSIASQILDIRLRETIREELGGTYGVRVLINYVNIPSTKTIGNIVLTYEPDRKNEIKKTILEIYDEFAKKGVSEKEIEVAKSILSNIYKSYALENEFWTSNITFNNIFNLKTYSSNEIQNIIKNIKIDDVNNFIKDYFLETDMFITELEPSKNVKKK